MGNNLIFVEGSPWSQRGLRIDNSAKLLGLGLYALLERLVKLQQDATLLIHSLNAPAGWEYDKEYVPSPWEEPWWLLTHTISWQKIKECLENGKEKVTVLYDEPSPWEQETEGTQKLFTAKLSELRLSKFQLGFLRSSFGTKFSHIPEFSNFIRTWGDTHNQGRPLSPHQATLVKFLHGRRKLSEAWISKKELIGNCNLKTSFKNVFRSRNRNWHSLIENHPSDISLVRLRLAN